MGWIAASNQKKEDIKPSTNMRFGEKLMMKLLVKGNGSPFKEDEKNPIDEPNLNKDESKLSLT